LVGVRGSTRLVVLAWVVAAAPAARAAGTPVEFSLAVSPSTGTEDEDFVATVQTVIHGINAAERYWPPDFGEFRVVDQRAQQSTQWSYNPARGQEISNVEVRRYRLHANRAGKLRIGEARLRVDNVEYKTKPVIVDVLSAGKLPQPVPEETPPVQGLGEGPLRSTFLHALVDKTSVTQGEQVTVTWLLYTRSEVLKFEPKPPKLDGFWVETLFDVQGYFGYHDEVVRGQQYAVAVVAKRALFPTRPGKLVIPRYEAELVTLTNSLTGDTPRLASPELTVEVQPLPPGAPAGFDPAWVGHFALEAKLDRPGEDVPAGDARTLTLFIRGTGALRRTHYPDVVIDGVKVEKPYDCDDKLDTSGDLIKGERKCLYLLRPLRGGKIAVGPIAVPFYDPATKSYDVARSEALELNVVGDPSQLGADKALAGAAKQNDIGRDILPPREEPRVGARVATQLYQSRWFLLALAAPGLAYALVILLDKLRQQWRRETPRARLRRARGRARKRLRTAELHIRGGRAGKFFGEVARVLIEHIEERVGEPISAMTRDQMREFLLRRGFPDETVEALARELENADFARFAPSASGPGEMRAALRRVRALLTAIERVRPPTLDGGGEEAAA
jgi:oxygen tolerance protein BatD